MIASLIRYLVFVLVAAGLVYGGYRMLTPATTKTTATEKAEKEERSDSVVLSDAKIAAAGIELAKASSGVLRDSLMLNGMVQPNQEALVQVTPRFPGIVREVRKRVGDRVQRGDVLAIVESNQSLTPYELKAALAGTVIDRQTTLGEYVSEQKPAFVIADLSTVWVDFSVYRRDLTRVSIGDQVLIDPADGGPAIDAKVSYLSPVGSSDTQSALARAIVPNSEQTAAARPVHHRAADPIGETGGSRRQILGIANDRQPHRRVRPQRRQVRSSRCRDRRARFGAHGNHIRRAGGRRVRGTEQFHRESGTGERTARQ